jgi:hypothetical protein
VPTNQPRQYEGLYCPDFYRRWENGRWHDFPGQSQGKVSTRPLHRLADVLARQFRRLNENPAERWRLFIHGFQGIGDSFLCHLYTEYRQLYSEDNPAHVGFCISGGSVTDFADLLPLIPDNAFHPFILLSVGWNDVNRGYYLPDVAERYDRIFRRLAALPQLRAVAVHSIPLTMAHSSDSSREGFTWYQIRNLNTWLETRVSSMNDNRFHFFNTRMAFTDNDRGGRRPVRLFFNEHRRVGHELVPDLVHWSPQGMRVFNHVFLFWVTSQFGWMSDWEDIGFPGSEEDVDSHLRDYP